MYYAFDSAVDSLYLPNRYGEKNIVTNLQM